MKLQKYKKKIDKTKNTVALPRIRYKMKVVETISNLNTELLKHTNKSIGFVPTMGSLHDGHLSLINYAQIKSDIVIVSIFVNPTQFNDPSDFKNYPSNHRKDLDKLSKEKVDIVFIPKSVNEIYANEKPLNISLDGIDEVMEGKYRKGHFDGVVRVVSLLFSIVRPQFAFFGEKDFQQLLIIKSMAKKHFKSIEVIGCPTKRDKNGLALSSRNLLLNEDDRKKAINLIKILKHSKSIFNNYDNTKLEKDSFEKLKDFSIPEYFEIRETSFLKRIKDKKTKQRAFVAAKIGNIRLIDNIELN